MSRVDPITAAGKAERKGPAPRHSGAMPVKELLEWAFSVERARVEPGKKSLVGVPSQTGIGIEYLIMERMALGGIAIDASRGRSLPADDADLIAAVVSTELLPHVALLVAEHARTCTRPDCMEDAVRRCVPVVWRQSPYGPKAGVVMAGEVAFRKRGRTYTRRIYYCPVRYEPSKAKIAAMRANYTDWWMALLDIRNTLRQIGLTRHSLTDELPPEAPWEENR